MLLSFGLYILNNQLKNIFNVVKKNENNRLENDINELQTISNSIDSLKQQIPIAIRDFSSQYGSNRSDSYVVSNICSNVEIYPAYGDSTHALVFRTYGPWWTMLPSSKETIKHFKRPEHNFKSRDFIDIEYNDYVYECISLNIYETYNPGTLEAVYIGKEDKNKIVKWIRVWKYPETFTIVLGNDQEYIIENGCQTMNDLFPNYTKTNSSMSDIDKKYMSKIFTNNKYPPAARLPRIVKISLKNKVTFPTKLVRLEFDHSTVSYYSEIDTVILYGHMSSIGSMKNQDSIEIQLNSTESNENNDETTNSTMDLTKLPFDILFLICSHLDLRSLVCLSSTCRLLHQQCLHSLQFQSLNLQPYWNSITNSSIEHFFRYYATQTRYLSLAWTKSIECSSFHQLLINSSVNLIQLNLSCCQYLTGQYIKIITNNCPNIEILNLDNCISLNNFDFIPLKYLNHLRLLNVYRTKIDYRTLLPLINNNKNTLEHINLGSCQRLGDDIGVMRLLFSQCSNLRSIDLWRMNGLTENSFLSFVGLPYDIGEEKRRILKYSKDEQDELVSIYLNVNMPLEIKSIDHMKYLSEIDLGWTNPPPGFVKAFVQQVGHSLIKLYLTACRRVNNEDIISVSENCSQLRQLDLLGSSIIIESTIECILKHCLYLEFIDLSFCNQISNKTIALWKCQYKSNFKRSYPPVRNDDIYTEFS